MLGRRVMAPTCPRRNRSKICSALARAVAACTYDRPSIGDPAKVALRGSMLRDATSVLGPYPYRP